MQLHSCMVILYCRRKWQPSPVFLPGKFHGKRSLAGYSPQSHKELDTTEAIQHAGIQSTRKLRKRQILLLLLHVIRQAKKNIKKKQALYQALAILKIEKEMAKKNKRCFLSKICTGFWGIGILIRSDQSLSRVRLFATP